MSSFTGVQTLEFSSHLGLSCLVLTRTLGPTLLGYFSGENVWGTNSFRATLFAHPDCEVLWIGDSRNGLTRYEQVSFLVARITRWDALLRLLLWHECHQGTEWCGNRDEHWHKTVTQLRTMLSEQVFFFVQSFEEKDLRLLKRKVWQSRPWVGKEFCAKTEQEILFESITLL